MSESTFPFGAPADDETSLTEEVSEGRKPLLLVGGLVGALVLGAAGFLLLGGGGEEEAPFAIAPRKAPVAVPAVPEAVVVLPVASTEQVGRNPFKARYVEPEAAPAPAAVEPPPAPAPVVQQPLPQPQLVVVQQPASAPTQAPAEYPITLVKVEPGGPSGITYTWNIGGKDIDVFQGQRFGTYGELVVLAFEATEAQPPRAVLQVGDATPIRVNIGETVNVL